jgi:mannose-6-phosphate isomerase
MTSIDHLPALLPLLPNRVWRTYSGGRTLDQMEGKPAPEDSHFPEDWLVSTTVAINKGREDHSEEGLSRTRIGGKDYFLRDLFEAYPEPMLGPTHVRGLGTQAGFLLKYLDSSIRLHMQCHPTAEFSRRHLNANAGKTEGYVILGHRPDVEPYVYLGFQRPPDPRRLRQAILDQDSDFILSCFDRVPVKAGDVFIVPGGLPHAIGEGVFMIEIMEPTDFAVRIEFERGGYVLPEAARFMGRDVDFAVSMFDFTAYPFDKLKERCFVEPRLLDEQPGGKRWSLFDDRYTDCFRTERLQIRGRYAVAHEGFRALVVTAGAGTVCAGDCSLDVQSGDRILIPHQTREIELASADGLEAVIALPPLSGT